MLRLRPRIARERRASCRYPADERRALLGWWDGPTYRTTTALLLDISLGGAALSVDELPAVESVVWTCLQDPEPTTWGEAVVVGRKSTRRGPHLIRLTFQVGCPYDLFRAAIRGLDLTGRAVENVATEFDSRDWR